MNAKYVDRGDVRLLQFDLLQSDHLSHFTTTIKGGVSSGAYASLNLGNLSDDDSTAVLENRKRLAEAMSVTTDRLFIPHQTHGDKIVVIDSDFLLSDKERQVELLEGVDALITDRKGICIGVTTADCVPVLIFDPKKKVLGVAHAGWKGTASRIAAKTVSSLIEHFESDPAGILVGIGPSISPEKFEVGDEVGRAFEDAGFDLSAISFRNPVTGKLHIDLWMANRLQLQEVGISTCNISVSEICTYSNPELFFSARRQTIHSGRLLTGGVIID